MTQHVGAGRDGGRRIKAAAAAAAARRRRRVPGARVGMELPGLGEHCSERTCKQLGKERPRGAVQGSCAAPGEP